MFRLKQHDETGSSTVGFLFALPLLCLMLAAIIDFGRLPLVMGDLTTEADQLASRFTQMPCLLRFLIWSS